jgi:lantibiotic biosynthesis protein
VQYTPRRYRIFETFCVRNPLFPLSLIQNLTHEETVGYTQLKLAWENPIIQEAIFLASPELVTELKKYFNTSTKEPSFPNFSLHFSFLKYLTRIASRATPFGLFAGCNLGYFDNQTQCFLHPPQDFNRKTRFDMNFVVACTQYFEKSPEFKPHLLFFPNTSLYKIADHYRYVEYTYEKSRRIHSVEGILHSEYLEKVIFAATNGKTIHDLTSLLIDSEITYDEAESFINELITNQILVSELEPALTGDAFFEPILDVLQRIHPNHPWLCLFKNQLLRLDQLDQSFGNNLKQYLDISTDLSSFPVKNDTKYLFQTDVYTTFSKCTLSQDYLKPLKKGLILLNKITPKTTDSSIIQFKKAFVKRYEQREVPLSLALDVEMGLGYPLQMHQVSDSPILDDLVFDSPKSAFQKHTSHHVEDFLFKKLTETIQQQSYTLTLHEKDFENWEENWHDLPPTLSALCELVTLHDHTYIYMNSAGGSSAANLLGRFSTGNKEVEKHIKNIIEKEEFVNTDVLHAEITHLPQDRTGNVLLRPVFRHYEIPYLAKAGVPLSRQLPLTDLYLSVKNDRLLLRSAQHDKEVIPHLTNAHNYSAQALPIYHFLCDLQTQNQRSALYFSFGQRAESFTFLPRVQYDQLILHKARWRFEVQLLQNIFSNLDQPEQLKDEIGAWKNQYQLPNELQWLNGDHTLLVHLNNISSVQMLLHSVKKQTSFVLEEFLFDNKNAVVQSKDGSYVNQVVFSFYREME